MNTNRMAGLDRNKFVVAFFPADVAEGAMVPCVFGDVGDFMYTVVML